MAVPHILIVSPASARENNGNWQTAKRWAHFLRGPAKVEIAATWTPASPAPDALIALHARRSAPALAAYAQHHPQRPSVLVLTGTDLYRDIAFDDSARASLARAHALVLLQPAGLAELDATARAKATVIYQSARALRPALRHNREVCMVGHLREEKDPRTFIAAAGLVQTPGVSLLHIGGALDPALGELAEATARANPRYRYLGAMAHGAVRQRIKRCHAMVIASRMEGGANVVIEALTCGLPVLASDISGNRGMLGENYEGYFAVGDAAQLARLIARSFDDAPFYQRLRAQCAARAPLFTPQAEQAAVVALLDRLLAAGG